MKPEMMATCINSGLGKTLLRKNNDIEDRCQLACGDRCYERGVIC